MESYDYYRKFTEKLPLPLAIVDMDLLDYNVKALLADCAEKNVRVATKSIRCLKVLAYIKELLGERFCGVMAFHPSEAIMLANEGYEDILLAYPYFREIEFEGIEKQHLAKICFMLDRPEHIIPLEKLGEKFGTQVKICIDIDVGVDFKLLHFGVFRSQIDSNKMMSKIISLMKSSTNLKVVGLMGYEAQIAGLTDKNPHTILNRIILLLKKLAIPQIKRRRIALVKTLCQHFKLEFVNGGGTASLKSTTQDPSVTEVTIGSGFYCPQLFSFYKDLNLKPAAFFALEVTRRPKGNIYTCAGGGYIASGPPSWDKVPHILYPHGAKLLENEGCGEVQTPIKYNGDLSIGEPVFFRHAKAGELCERFNEILLIRNSEIWKTVKTYRGMGYCFL